MEVRSCKHCRRLFNYISGPHLCPVCREEQEAKFSKVKSYLYENPGATANQVSEVCEVSHEQIKQWLREGRLELAKGSAITLECQNCGTQIQSGKMCSKCANDLHRTLQALLPGTGTEKNQAQRDGTKMGYLTK